MANEKVLIVEDDLTLGELIGRVMTKRGLSFDIFVRVQLTDQGLLFMDADGKTSVVDLSQYWVGLVDSRLKGSVLQGIDLVSILMKQGLAVVATSGLDTLNELMIKAGAIMAIRKDNLFIDMLNGRIDLRQQVLAAQTAQGR